MSKILQQFEGVVEEVDGDTFWATLHNLTDKSAEDEFAEIGMDKLEVSEQEWVGPGAIFNWTITEDENGEGKNSIVFNKQWWTQEMLDAVEKEASNAS